MSRYVDMTVVQSLATCDAVPLLSEKLLDGGGDGRGLGVGAVSLDDIALLVDQELGEVPLCGAKEDERRGGGSGQQRMRVTRRP